jgi:protein TonB
MYRPELDNRDKGGAMAAVIAVHAGLLFALLNISGRIDLADPQSAMRIFDVNEVPPPPPPPPPLQRVDPAKPKEKEGGSAPKNIKSEATPIVAPKPRIVIPPLPQIAASETPRQGTAPTQGASDVRGPGTGAGGAGTGTGSGSGGSGPGGGGGGGAAVPVSLIRGISNRDYPPGVRESWPRGGAIYLRLRIEPDGRPSRCDVMRSFGSQSIDQWTCSLVTQRGVFRPARDARGNPVAAWFGYKQVDIGRSGQ